MIDKELARVRSNQDAQASNQYARSAAYMAMLINGGAATAVLAFASNETATKFDGASIGNGLMGYATGVACGAVMMFLMTFCVERWAEYWRDIAESRNGKDNKCAATFRGNLAYGFFFLSISSFCYASWTISVVFTQ